MLRGWECAQGFHHFYQIFMKLISVFAVWIRFCRWLQCVLVVSLMKDLTSRDCDDQHELRTKLSGYCHDLVSSEWGNQKLNVRWIFHLAGEWQVCLTLSISVSLGSEHRCIMQNLGWAIEWSIRFVRTRHLLHIASKTESVIVLLLSDVVSNLVWKHIESPPTYNLGFLFQTNEVLTPFVHNPNDVPLEYTSSLTKKTFVLFFKSVILIPSSFSPLTFT